MFFFRSGSVILEAGGRLKKLIVFVFSAAMHGFCENIHLGGKLNLLFLCSFVQFVHLLEQTGVAVVFSCGFVLIAKTSPL